MLKFIFALCLLALAGCGDGSSTYENKPAPDDKAWTDVQPLVEKNCGGCHGVKAGLPAFDSAAAFKGSKAKARLANGTMPPAPKTISAEDKQALLAYLGG